MPGNPLNLTLPTVGQTLWGGTLNSILQAIIDDIEAKVTPDEIEVNQDLDFEGNEPTDVGGVGFRNDSSGDTRRLFFSGNELWVTDGYGNHIRLTTTGTINVSTVGSITGLAGSGASVSYDAGDTRFTFLDHTGAGAEIEGGAVRLLKPGSTTVAAELRGSSGMTADYTLTFPSGSSARTNLLTFVPAGANASLVPSRDVQVELIRVTESGSLAALRVDAGGVFGGGVRVASAGSASMDLTFNGSGTWTPLPYSGLHEATMSYNGPTGGYARGWWYRVGSTVTLQWDFYCTQPSGSGGTGTIWEIRGISNIQSVVGAPLGTTTTMWPGSLTLCTIPNGGNQVNPGSPGCFVTGSYVQGTLFSPESVIRLYANMNDHTGSRFGYTSAADGVRLAGTVTYRVA